MIKLYPYLLAASLVVACGSADSSDAPESAAADAPPSQVKIEAAAETKPEPAASSKASDPNLVQEIALLKEGDVLEISWEDLMPEGEEQVLAQLYESFFREQELLLRQQSQSLSDFGTSSGNFLDSIQEGGAADQAIQIGTYNTVDVLNGVKVRLPGYVVPLKFGGDAGYDEFILVPYFGACLHSPPPPPNQTLYVTAEPRAKVSSIFEPVWVEGTISTGEFSTHEANSAYQLTLSKIETYTY